MKEYFLKAITLLNTNIRFVFLLAIPALFSPVFYLEVSESLVLIYMAAALLATLSVFVSIGASSYFAETIKSGKNKTPFCKNIKKNFLNLFLVWLLMISPFMLLYRLLSSSGNAEIYGLISLIVQILTIYVVPLVFLRQIRIRAITLGVKFLVDNVNLSLPLAGLILLNLAMTRTFQRFLVPSATTEFFIKAIYSYISGFISYYLSFILFIVACMVLVEKLTPQQSIKS